MADLVGNRLGDRAEYLYVADDGTNYRFTGDESVNDAIGNVAPAGTETRISVTSNCPISPRYVYVELDSDPSVRKKIYIGDATLALYATLAPTQVTINGVGFTTTGRVGERATF